MLIGKLTSCSVMLSTSVGILVRIKKMYLVLVVQLVLP